MKATVNDRTKMAVLAFVLFCASLFLSDFSAKNPAVANIGAVAVSEAIRPFQVSHNLTSQWMRSLWTNYVDLIDVKRENLSLKQRLDKLEGKNALLAELRHENSQLRHLLAMKDELPVEGVVARVIGYDPSKWVRAVVIDRGKQSGLLVGMPVVNGKGVVGQLVAVSPRTARVLLISDHASGVDVIIQNENRSRGVVEGSGGNSCELQYVTREEDVRVGDRLVTSGIDGVYPKGLLVGTISNFSSSMGSLFHRIEVKPVVEFDSLETVLVIVAYQLESSGVAKEKNGI